jgi:peptidoglycan hydrolase CwlO-like protein
LTPLEAYLVQELLKRAAWAADKALGGIVSEYVKKLLPKAVRLQSKVEALDSLVQQNSAKRAELEQEVKELAEFVRRLWREKEAMEARNIALTVENANLRGDQKKARARKAPRPRNGPDRPRPNR